VQARRRTELERQLVSQPNIARREGPDADLHVGEKSVEQVQVCISPVPLRRVWTDQHQSETNWHLELPMIRPEIEIRSSSCSQQKANEET